MSLKLAAGNLGWQKQQDEEIYTRMQALGYTGLEVAPTRIFPDRPYECLNAAALFGGYLKNRWGFSVPSMQSIWYGKSGSIFDSDDAEALTDYTRQAFDFARALNCPNLVFGNPRQRSVPDGCDPRQAEPFFARLGILAGQAGVRLALEANPVLYNTNFLNTTPQAMALVKKLGLPGLSVNLDVGTMIYNGESVADIAAGMQYVSHVHISEPGLVPIEERPLHRELAGLLHAVGYKGFVSLEMKATDTDTVIRCLEYIAEVFG